MAMTTEYPPMTPEERALFARVGTKAQTDDDLIAAATFEADHAMRSLTPHCLPTEGGLPHNPDHANACAHRCWSFLKELAELRAKRAPVQDRLVDSIDDAINHHCARQDDPLRIPRWKSERVADLVNELTCGWINVGLSMPKTGQ
jgi:hypothetical protein